MSELILFVPFTGRSLLAGKAMNVALYHEETVPGVHLDCPLMHTFDLWDLEHSSEGLAIPDYTTSGQSVRHIDQ
jgi:hypothetical protein